MRLTLLDVAAATGGEVIAGEGDSEVDGASVDSRSLPPGALFVALRAGRDGHDYVADAVARGAAAALVERPVAGLAPGAGLVRVDDTAAALLALGGAARRRLPGVPVAGITGSTGKTSTKDFTAAALAPGMAVAASPASWNNEIGVPLTLLAAAPDTGAVVVEMGARGRGHIAALAAVARPRIGVITNIGLAHTEFFGSRAEVAVAKGELLEALPAGGAAVLNADDDMTPALARRSPAPVLTVGHAATADIRIGDLAVDADLRASFRLDTPWGATRAGPLEMRGAHQAQNAAVAVAVAGLLGVAPGEAAAALTAASGSPWRMELDRTPGGLVVLNDAYNANPTSMAAALDALRALDGGRRRFAVLGHMAELGECSEDEHRRLGRLAAACGLHTLVVVGSEAAALAEGARESGAHVVAVDGADAAVDVLAGRLAPGDTVLVKGSRVVGLERVAAALSRWEPPR